MVVFMCKSGGFRLREREDDAVASSGAFSIGVLLTLLRNESIMAVSWMVNSDLDRGGISSISILDSVTDSDTR